MIGEKMAGCGKKLPVLSLHMIEEREDDVNHCNAEKLSEEERKKRRRVFPVRLYSFTRKPIALVISG